MNRAPGRSQARSEKIFAGSLLAGLLLVGSAFAENTTASDAERNAERNAERWVYYLHGRIIELEGADPTHPKFGFYDYSGIVTALGRNGATVISEVRGDTDAFAYGERLAAEIEQRLADGVSPDRIAVVGFSKGGAIALATSRRLARSDVRFVVLGACGDGVVEWLDGELRGEVLSISEASDSLVGSCKELFAVSNSGLHSEEIEIQTGLDHGAFYQPREVWLKPTLDWIER